MGFFSEYRRRQQQLAFYQMPDMANPLSWGAVRENIEHASNRDFLKQTRHLDSGSFNKIQKMFLRRPSTSSSDLSYRPGSTRSRDIERPGFLQGLDD